MEQHLQDLKCGGRPMNKNELRIKELEKENQQLKENNQNMQEEIKDLCKKLKVKERSRRKMQKSLMEKLQQKEDIINKAKEYIENNPLYDIDVYEYSICLNGIDDEQTRKELLEILDNKGE